MSCPTFVDWTAFVDRDLEPSAAGVLEEHRVGCEACAVRVARLRATTQELRAALTPSADEAFVRSVARRLERPVPAPRRWRGAVLAAATMAAGVLVMLAVPRAPRDSGFTARGGGGRTEASLLGFDAFTPRSGGAPLQPGAVLRPGEGLSFVLYHRTRSAPYFMVFGLDAQREVHWFYPSYPSEASDPWSEKLPERPGAVPLREGVTPEAPPRGRFEVVVLFSAKPLRARDVETVLTRDGRPALERLAPGLTVQSLALEIGGDR